MISGVIHNYHFIIHSYTYNKKKQTIDAKISYRDMKIGQPDRTITGIQHSDTSTQLSRPHNCNSAKQLTCHTC